MMMRAQGQFAGERSVLMSLRRAPSIASTRRLTSEPMRGRGGAVRCEESVVGNAYHISLSDYMLTLDKPLGIRFAHTLDGKVFVEALAKNGKAESSRMIMVGDILKKTSAVSGEALWDVEDFGRTMHAIKKRNGPINLILERPTSPASIHPLLGDGGLFFNRGRVAFATWNGSYATADPDFFETDAKNDGKIGLSMFSSRFLRTKGLKAFATYQSLASNAGEQADGLRTRHAGRAFSNEVVTYFHDEKIDGDVEWTHGNFSLENYTLAFKRSEKDLRYDYSLGLRFTKITGDIFVGSCLQSAADAKTLAEDLSITAVLDFQCKSEKSNWNIDTQSIKLSLNDHGVLLISFPIREVDSVDLRRKLPIAAAILYRLLRQEHRVYVTCTTGLDRSPACVIAYFHWIRDVALQDAFDFVQSIHPCGPDRPALVWATWDLVAMAERDNHKGPATHTVQFVWNHGCREGEEVLLVGDFKGEWDEPIKAIHAGGPKYFVDVRLPQGKSSSSFQIIFRSLYLPQPPNFKMDHASSSEIASFLWELQLPPLTEDQENNLTDEERANRESLAAHIEKLQNIALRIEHDAMCIPLNRGSFHDTTRGRSVDDPTLTDDERSRGRKTASNLANLRVDMVQNLHAVMESPIVPETLKMKIVLSMPRLVNSG